MLERTRLAAALGVKPTPELMVYRECFSRAVGGDIRALNELGGLANAALESGLGVAWDS